MRKNFLRMSELINGEFSEEIMNVRQNRKNLLGFKDSNFWKDSKEVRENEENQ